MEPTITHETPVHFGTQYISPVSGPSLGPSVLSPQLPIHHNNHPETGTSHTYAHYMVEVSVECMAQFGFEQSRNQ